MKRAAYLKYRDRFFDALVKTLKKEGYGQTTKETIRDIRRLRCWSENHGVTRSVVVDVPFYWNGATRGITVQFGVDLYVDNEGFVQQFENRNIGKNNTDGEINYYKIRTFFLGSGELFYKRLYANIKKEILDELVWLDGFNSLEKLLFYLNGDFNGVRGQSWPYLIMTGDLGRIHRSEERKNKLISIVKRLAKIRDAKGKEM